MSVSCEVSIICLGNATGGKATTYFNGHDHSMTVGNPAQVRRPCCTAYIPGLPAPFCAHINELASPPSGFEQHSARRKPAGVSGIG